MLNNSGNGASIWLDLDPAPSPTARQSVVVQFAQDVGSTLTVSDLDVFNLTTNSTIPVLAPTYDPATRIARFPVNTPSRMLSRGNYEITILKSDVSPNLGFDTTHQNYFSPVDFDRNRSVAFSDLVVIARNMDQSGKTWSQGDANLDGTVNMTDLTELSRAFNSTLSAPPTFSTTLTVNAEPQPANTSLTPIRVTWFTDIYLNETGSPSTTPTTYRVYRRAAAAGGAYTPVSPEGFIFEPGRRGAITWIDTGVQDGTKYDYRVRPIYANGSIGTSTEVKSATTILPAPEITEINVNDAGGVIHWKDNSRNESAFELAIISGGTTRTVDFPSNDDATDYGFIEDLLPNTEYAFALVAKNAAARSATSANVNKTTQSGGVREPGQAWSLVLGYNGATDSQITYEWERPTILEPQKPTTLKVTNLLRHSYISVGATVSVPQRYFDPLLFEWVDIEADSISVTAEFAGISIEMTPGTSPNLAGYWIFSGAKTGPHSGSRAEGMIEVSGLPGYVGYGTWDTPGFAISTYFPFVEMVDRSVNAGEHFYSAGRLRMQRVGGQFAAHESVVLEKPLTVQLDDKTESNVPHAEDEDFEPSFKWKVKFRENESEVAIEYQGKDDDLIEDKHEFILAHITSGAKSYKRHAVNYAFSASAEDDDFQIKWAQARFGDYGITRDVGHGQEAYIYDAYSVPHWNDANGDGSVPSAGTADGWIPRYDNTKKPEQNPEVSFPINLWHGDEANPAKVYGTVRFKVRGNPVVSELSGSFSGDILTSSAKQSGQIVTWTQPDEPGFTFIEIGYISENALEQKINAGDVKLNLKMERPKRDNQSVEEAYGPIITRAYVTRASSNGDFHTVVSIAAEGAKGNTPNQTLEIVNSMFDQKMKDMNLKRTEDEQVLNYRALFVQGGPPIYGTVQDLLLHGDAQCNAWSDLFVRALQVNGILATSKTLLVHPEAGQHAGPHPRHDWRGRFTITNLPAHGFPDGSPTGQWTTHERPFSNHVVTIVTGFEKFIYDPTFGIRQTFNAPTLATNALSYESLVLDELENTAGDWFEQNGQILDLVW
jgi:hypothetical protein